MSQEILPKQPTVKNPPEQFAGDVWVDPIVAPQDDDQRATLALVKFAPGARTAWHSHARGQFLRVTQGVAHFGTRDGRVITARPGDTVYVSAGEEHFHASAEGTFMEHFAMLENADDPSTTTTWLEHVTDEDLAGR
jgi:quercetin dioxygenase-like cupin family protein